MKKPTVDERFYTKREIQEILWKLFINMQSENKVQPGNTLQITFGLGMPKITISVSKKQKESWMKHYWKYYQKELDDFMWPLPF